MLSSTPFDSSLRLPSLTGRPVHVQRVRSAGLTILEVLVAAAIASVAMSLLIPGLVRQLRYVQDSSRMNSVETVISRDLDWMRMYARYWKMKSGPYNLSNSFTKSSSVFKEAAVLDYEPSAAACNGENPAAGQFSLADRFLQDAGSLSGSSDANARPPFSIASGSFSNFSGLPDNVSLTRTITPMGSRVLVSYEVTGSAVDNLYLNRQASLLLQASAWCDRLQ